MWRRCLLGSCVLLTACDRLVVITAVDQPAETDGELPDLEPEEGDDAETSEAPGEMLDSGAGDSPPMNTPLDARVADAATFDGASEDARAAADADAGDIMLPACAGKRALDLCWYFGAEGASCEQTCRGRGGFDARAVRRLGSGAQGGSLRACGQVLSALGYAGNVTPGYREDGIGLGCHVWENGDGWWVHTPDFSSSARVSVATIACACMR